MAVGAGGAGLVFGSCSPIWSVVRVVRSVMIDYRGAAGSSEFRGFIVVPGLIGLVSGAQAWTGSAFVTRFQIQSAVSGGWQTYAPAAGLCDAG